MLFRMCIIHQVLLRYRKAIAAGTERRTVKSNARYCCGYNTAEVDYTGKKQYAGKSPGSSKQNCSGTTDKAPPLPIQTATPQKPAVEKKVVSPMTPAVVNKSPLPQIQSAGRTGKTVQPEKPVLTGKNASLQQSPAGVQKVRPDTSAQQQAAVRLPKYVLTELAFAGNVFGMLNRAIPAGVLLTALSMDSCSTVCITGTGMCKDSIRDMFTAIRHEQVNILRPPQTFIKAGKTSNTYLFTVVCTVRPSFCADVSPDFIVNPAVSNRAAVLALVKKLARKNHIGMSKAPRVVTTQNKDGFIRTVYSFSAKTSYSDFGNFVQSIRDAKLPCAITGCTFVARNPSAERITSQMVITTR